MRVCPEGKLFSKSTVSVGIDDVGEMPMGCRREERPKAWHSSKPRRGAIQALQNSNLQCTVLLLVHDS